MSTNARHYEIAPHDEQFPSALYDLDPVPSLLYVRGFPEVLSLPSVSIIGSRRPTPYGRAIASLAGTLCAQKGLCVVSGGALGCDAIASRACLAAGGKTAIIAGTGADMVYPKRSSDVFSQAVASGGAVVSLERWGAPPQRYAFPKRNRLIAALSPLLVVAEASMPSGTFSTATCAAELNRRVVCAPGSIFSPTSRGTNHLIECGASLIVDQSSLEMLLDEVAGSAFLAFTEKESSVLERDAFMTALMSMPMRPSDLASALEVSLANVLIEIAEREACGQIVRLPDGRWSPSKQEFLRASSGTFR